MDTMSKFVNHIMHELSIHDKFTPSRVRLAVIGDTIIEGIVQVDPVKFGLELTSGTNTPTCEDVTVDMWTALQSISESM